MARAKSQRRYSAFEHLARAIYLRRYSREMLMVTLHAAFFDASGKREGFDVLTVAGAATPMKKWLRFDKRVEGRTSG